MGRFKNIETPEKLYDLFMDYKKHSKENPYEITTETPKGTVKEKREKALTFAGFEGYLASNGIMSHLSDYESNRDGRYEDYASIITHIKKICKGDTITGGLSQVYNPNLTARIHGLGDKQDLTSNGKEIKQTIIFGGKEVEV